MWLLWGSVTNGRYVTCGWDDGAKRLDVALHLHCIKSLRPLTFAEMMNIIAHPTHLWPNYKVGAIEKSRKSKYGAECDLAPIHAYFRMYCTGCQLVRLMPNQDRLARVLAEVARPSEEDANIRQD